MSISFELRLIDSVGGPARKAAEALRKVQEQAERTQAAVNKQSGASGLGKAAAAADLLAKKQQKAFSAVFGKIGAAEEKAALKRREQFSNSWANIGLAAARKQEREHEKHKREKEEGSFRAGLMEGIPGIGKIATGALLGGLMVEGIKTGAELLMEAGEKFVDIIKDGFKEAISASSKRQTLELGAKLSLGTGGGKEFMEDVGRFAGRTGFDDDEIARMLLPLRRAGMGSQESRSAFAAAGDVAAGEGAGGDAARVESLLEIFKKIKLKGGVTDKLLIGLGVNVNDFFTDLAKQLGIGKEEAKKRAESGKIDPQRLLNTVYGGIEKRQGGELGTGQETYSKTMEARLRKLGQLPEEYLKKMIESPAFGKLSDAFGNTLESLSPESPNGKKIIAALQEVFDKISGWIIDLSKPENLDKLINGFKDVLEVAKSIVDALQGMVKAVESVVDAYKTVTGFGDWLALHTTAAETGTEQATRVHDAQLERERNQNNPVRSISNSRENSKTITVSPKIENHFHGDTKEDVKGAAAKAASDMSWLLGKAVSEAGAK